MTLYGIDVSSNQHGMNTGTIPADFVIVKCTGGTGYVNPDFPDELAEAKAAGKRTVLYHYVHELGYQGSAADESAWFLKHAGPYLNGSTGAAMDWESDNVWDSAYALEFCQAVKSGSGVTSLAYGSVSQLEALRPCHDAGFPIWAAAYTLGYQPIYGYNPPQGPIGIPEGMAPVMWQFTSSDYLTGWSAGLDVNIFYGDGPAFDALCAVNGTITPQGYTPQEDTLSQAEVDTIVGTITTLFKQWHDGTREVIIAEIDKVPDAIMDLPIPNATGNGNTNLRGVVAWNDPHVNAIIAAVSNLNPGSDPAVITKAVQDALAAGLKVTVSTK